MFVQNQISHLRNHKDVIISEMTAASEMLFVVAYVRENGVDVILDKIKNKPAKLLCSFDMGITQLSGIKKLLEHNVEVKVYRSNEGTFHPKIWLFGKDNQWKMLIGSANLTRSALIDNVEASVLVEDQAVISNALLFFGYLWDKDNASSVSIEDIDILQRKIIERKNIKHNSVTVKEDDAKKIEMLFEYIKNWIDIPKLSSQGISSLWRGWYIIPDQGYITDELIENLKAYLPFIGDGIGMSDSDEKYQQLLNIFVANSNFKGKNLKTSPHKLFVRQAKNYLMKFGWCYHPIKNNGKLDKKTLCLTELGNQVLQCENLRCVRNLYTNHFLNYTFNGLNVVRFTKYLLDKLDYLTLDEFNYFVTHAYSTDDFETIVSLVRLYRSLENPGDFNAKCTTYFKEMKEPTAKNVYGNYVKNIKHTISVIAWCNGFSLESGQFTLRLNNETK